MSAWAHLICWACWRRREEDRQPAQVRGPEIVPEPCCFCALPTASGIYIRGDPEAMACKGEGPVHAERLGPGVPT